MSALFQSQKLFFRLGEGTPESLSLAEAFCGSTGTVMLGKGGVYLWTPHMGKLKGSRHEADEVVCDLRFDPLAEGTATAFKQAAKGLFLPARIGMLRGRAPESIAWVLERFDYALIPATAKLKNTPADFRKRILGYIPPDYGRREPQYSD